jgi:NAD(P)-dependent dehydrogenase (short-subunit alcohol dehydrogenase family)/acyl dehydratase
MSRCGPVLRGLAPCLFMPALDVVRFSLEDLDLFSAASGDLNPIHCSASYAASTRYGGRLVFGALGAIACLGKVTLPHPTGIHRIVADFHRPMFAGVDYTVRITAPDGRYLVRLLDGSVTVMSLAVFIENETGSVLPDENTDHPGYFQYSEAVDRRESDIEPGLTIKGRHQCDGPALHRLRQRWAVSAHACVVRALLWASYFTGMEMPGKHAIFFRFAATFSPSGHDPALPLNYEAVVKRFDPRLQQARTQVRLLQHEHVMGEGECVSFIRTSLQGSTREDVQAYMPPSEDLSGKVALVIGASRGLGVAIVHLLASQGAHVIATARSPLDEAYTGGDARISTVSGNACDRGWLEQLLEQIKKKHGRLNVLVCNAFPPVVPLRLESNALERIQTYVQQAVAMVLAPLSVFLELLDQSDGCAVIVSSSAVRNPVKEWPHYIAAKQAIEGFAAVAPLQYPRVTSLIVRPQKLLTEMTNTPMGRKNAVPPGLVAAQIVERLKRPLPAGVHQIVEA